MTDTVESIHGSIIQHGPHNNRIYLMHLHGKDVEGLIARLDRLAAERGYGKIFAKIPATCWHSFKSAGYIQEARVPGFFNGQIDGLFIAKFLCADRQQTQARSDFTQAQRKPTGTWPDDPRLLISACSPEDAKAMAAIYRQTFESYAFPIHRPEYIQCMMRKNALYFSVRTRGQIAALAAAEIDATSQTCEMTDFATLPEYRRKGLAYRLLGRLDDEAHKRGVKTAYTIARRDSDGMNRVFAQRGYLFAGCLAKNTQIGGRIRSMLVWYKSLA
jgi:putative beta-lysine N-acetyltransferase